jgi:EndoU nuclease-like protein
MNHALLSYLVYLSISVFIFSNNQLQSYSFVPNTYVKKCNRTWQPILQVTQSAAGAQGARKVTTTNRFLTRVKNVDVEALRQNAKFRIFYKGEPVEIDVEHLYTAWVKERVRRSGHRMKEQLVGFHHDFLSELVNEGILQHTEVKAGLCGTFKSTPIINGIQYNSKTLFSPDWTPEKVIEAIIEAFEASNPEQWVFDRGSYIFESFAKCGLEIRIVFDPVKLLIKTAFPIVK